MEPFVLIVGSVIAFGTIAAGLAIGALVMLLYQIPSELRTFQQSIQEAAEPLKAALANAAQAQREATVWARRYSDLMRTLGTGQEEPEQRSFRRNRRQSEDAESYHSWNPDWMPNTEPAQGTPPPPTNNTGS